MHTAGVADDRAQMPSPEDCGWVRVTDLGLAKNTGLSTFPRSGQCSVALCTASTTAAIERAPTRTAPGHWQLYCAEHAHARGVDLRGDELIWADGFPLTAKGEIGGR